MWSVALVLSMVVGYWFQLGFTTSQSYVTSIVEDTDGSIWCGTSGGIVHYHPSHGWLEPMLYPDGLPWVGVNDILLQDSLLWVATSGGGLVLVDGGSPKVFSSYEGVPGSGEVYDVHQAKGFIWVGTDGGLARGNSDGFTVIDAQVTGGAFDADKVTGMDHMGDVMYFATDRGVYSLDLSGSVFEASSWTDHGDSTSVLGIRKFLIHSRDSIFGYGPGGVSMSDGNGRWMRLLDYSSHLDSTINGLLVTGDGLLAAGRVVIRYDGDKWEHYGNGYPPESYCSCLARASGRIWCGYGVIDGVSRDAGRGLGYLEDGTWRHLPVPGMGGGSCYQAAFGYGRMYVGSHRSGLMAYYPDYGWVQFTKRTAAMPTDLRCYSAAVTDSLGAWTAAYHWGLTWIGDMGTPSFEDDTVITFVSDSLQGVPPGAVQVISPLLNNQVVMLAAQGGALWIAQEAYWQTPDEPSGLVVLSGNPLKDDLTWTVRTEEDGLAAKNLQKIYPCGDDSLWIAFTSEGGCQLLVHGSDPADKSGDRWYPAPGKAYDTSWGLPSGQVFCFAGDADGTMLLGTGNGICRWNGSGFVQVPGIQGMVKAMGSDGSTGTWCMTQDALWFVDGDRVSAYTPSNSIYIPTSRMENEFASFDAVSGILYFSSSLGLWSVSPGTDGSGGDAPVFYPQPYLPSAGEMKMSWNGDEQVSVKFFSLDGEYLGEVGAASWNSWSWNGVLGGETLSSGVYVLLVESGGKTVSCKMAIVR